MDLPDSILERWRDFIPQNHLLPYDDSLILEWLTCLCSKNDSESFDDLTLAHLKREIGEVCYTLNDAPYHSDIDYICSLNTYAAFLLQLCREKQILKDRPR